MLYSLKRYFFLLSCFLLITACSVEPTKETEPQSQVKNEQKEKESAQNPGEEEKEGVVFDSPPVPGNLEEMMAYPVGKLSSAKGIGDNDVKMALEAIPALSEKASDSELTDLFEHLYSLYKKEYEDPKAAMASGTVSVPEQDTPADAKPETFNVEVILDSSGSMANKLGGKTRMELAKESIERFASSLPREANISLRVYGHKGTGSDKDKKVSCSSNELIYPMQAYNKESLSKALGNFKPAGWTPLAKAIAEAQKDLSQYKGDNNKNIIYIVSDGIETCGGNPVAAAKSLKDSGIAPVVNIIGFDVAGKDQQQLQDVAKAAGGTYANVKSQQQLYDEFNKTVEESLEWLNWKNNQNLSTYKKYNKQSMNIYEITNKWYMDNIQEKNLIMFSVNDLKNKEKLTTEQKEKLLEMNEQYYEGQMDSIQELKAVLINATNEEQEKTLEKIDKIYKENAPNN
ncbi:VWA domain-containing protein [Bacillus sp. REN3]|uniref:vWA domain-containing protein n=1 Tax=Bacillus sp. REN3 TaxID=2802440 RepID=UPI001AEDDE71|nr:VWA domain-containing protein [Bacillus sp. REN3]